MCHISEVEELIALYDEKQKTAETLTEAEVLEQLDLIEQFGGAL